VILLCGASLPYCVEERCPCSKDVGCSFL